ncbi:hypothetical protein B484DRAFT_391297, partial [Ochromonadaceae sp. CCMP2298]
MWQLLESFRTPLADAQATLERAERLGWESPQVSRQSIEYVLVSVMVIGGFFQHYYRASAFQTEENSRSSVKDRQPISLSHVDELVLYFFDK